MELKDKAINASYNLYKPETIPEEVSAYREPVDLDEVIGDLTLVKLKEIFDDVIARSQEKINTEALTYGSIKKEEVKITDRIDYIKIHVKRGTNLSFRKLIESQKTKMNIIVTFLAVLELMKSGELAAMQDGKDGDIILLDPADAPEPEIEQEEEIPERLENTVESRSEV